MGPLRALALVSIAVSCTAAGRARIAEILYDAIGDDTGREFVELINPTSAPLALAGLRLEAGDGAGPGRWTLRWTAGAHDSIAASGRFVIGGALVEPRPDAQVTLELQNGPDAVRLVWPDGAIEVVGYGPLADGEYFCGAPAADAPSGSALARIPDDADRGSNALDFRPAEPTPGRANQVTLDAAIRKGSLELDPPQPDPGAPARLAATLIDRGTQPFTAGAVALTASSDGVRLATTPTGAVAAGDSAHVAVALPGLPAGIHTLTIRAAVAGDERPEDDADSLRVRVGPGPLQITEIQFHPGGGEGEWIEVRARDAAPVALAGFTLSDRGGHPAALPADALSLPPDSLALLVEHRDALLARFPGLDPARVIEVSPWAALNNSDDSSGVADLVVIRERDGTPCDRVAYSAHGIPAGVPLELGEPGWTTDSDPAGTPLAPPRGPPALHSRFDLGPRRLRPGESPRLAWSLPWARARLSIEVFDLAGRRVTRIAETAVGAHGERRVDGLPGPGLYLLAIAARSEDGAGVVRETRAVRVTGAAP